MHSRTAAIVISVLFTALLVEGCTTTASEPTPPSGYAISDRELVVGVVAGQGDETGNVQPVLDYLARSTGKKVEVVESRSTAALLEMAQQGQVDIVQLASTGYVAARAKNVRVQPVAAFLPVGSTSPTYHSVGVVKGDSPIAASGGLKGEPICFAGTESEGGYIYPLGVLAKSGLTAPTDFSSVLAGPAASVAARVQSGSDCAAGFYGAWTEQQRSAATSLGLKVISDQPVQAPILAVSTRLPSVVQASVAHSLIGLTSTAIVAKKIAVSPGFRLTFGGLVAIPAHYFDPAQQICDAAALAICR